MTRTRLLVILAVVVVLAVLLFLGRDATRSGAPSSDAAPADTSPAQQPGARPSRAGGRASTAPAAPDGGVAPTASRVVVRTTWGSGPDQLGRERPQEGNPEAPMSLVADRDGSTVVLDQVNNRLVRFGPDGTPRGTTPLPLQVPQDVALAADGTTLVLDRLSDKAVALLDPAGRQRGELPLAGKGIDDPGGVTGLFVDGEDVYVEREHGALVRLGNTSGEADPERPEIPGRPSRDGKSFLNAGIIDAASGRLYVTSFARDTRTERFTRELRLNVPLLMLLLLDSDRRGVIYLAATAEQGGQPSVVLTCLAPEDGRPLGRVELPANLSADETFRELSVADDGGVLYLHRDESGAQLERWTCP